jgi:hypothetical protein
MKKVLIIASAVIFAASTVGFASIQKETGKVTPQKTTTPARQEVQKPAATTDVKSTTQAKKTTETKEVKKVEKKMNARPKEAKMTKEIKPAEPVKK